MEKQWIGRAVSVRCDDDLGIFQGFIKDISDSYMTIIRAFRNGVPLRMQYAELTLRSDDILDIEILPMHTDVSTWSLTNVEQPTTVRQPNFAMVGTGARNSGAERNGGGNGRSNSSSSGHGNGAGNNAGVDYSSGGGEGASDNTVSSALSNRIRKMKISEGVARPNGIRSGNTPASTPTRTANNNNGSGGGGSSNISSPLNSNTPRSVAQFFGKLIPPKVEVRMGAALGASENTGAEASGGAGAVSNPIDIINNLLRSDHYFAQSNGNGRMRNNGANGNVAANSLNSSMGVSGGGGVGNPRSSKNQQRNKPTRENNQRQNQTFGTSVDDPLLNEDFDFEGNLALFDKRAIWNSIDAENQQQGLETPEHAGHGSDRNRKYRHDENILVSAPPVLRQIETKFEGSSDFVTDEGLIIPTIPASARLKIENNAEKGGLSHQRQVDILARGTTDLAILMMGGARRLTPKNSHQWPKIVIVCQKSSNMRVYNIGAATGRQLASQGLKVWLYCEMPKGTDVSEPKSPEIALFKATGNGVMFALEALPTPDLVILSTNSNELSSEVKKWMSKNRASILAIDPPPCGIDGVSMKYSILPTLPLNGISSNNCGKLYLCNLGIPDKFYRDVGIKYKSPFGHKFVIPIHSKD